MKFCLDDEKIPLGFEIFLLKKIVFIIITCRIVENSKIIRFPFGYEKMMERLLDFKFVVEIEIVGFWLN